MNDSQSSSVLISSYSETAEDENTASVIRAFSMCVVNKLCHAIHSFIAEIMAPYAWYQMLPQIYSITIAFHLTITNHAYGFVLGSHQQYLRHDTHWMNDRLSVVTSSKVNKGDI